MTRFQDLRVANADLDDRVALEARWERDGYWFFRDVLDLDAVAELRGVFMTALKTLGVIDRDARAPIWNGASLVNFPKRMEPLVPLKPWQAFTRSPAINALLTRMLGDEPFWVPITEYRAVPPAAEDEEQEDRFVFLHQDGFYNEGIPFKICWIPLDEIDEATGGLALGEGLHRGPSLHDMSNPPYFTIPTAAVPGEAWRRSDYRRGDVLLFDLDTPHSGLANHSDRFRLSMDIRVMPKSGRRPFIGTVRQIAPDSITVESSLEGRASFALDQKTLTRAGNGTRLSSPDFASHYAPGTEVIITAAEGRAILVRPTH